MEYGSKGFLLEPTQGPSFLISCDQCGKCMNVWSRRQCCEICMFISEKSCKRLVARIWGKHTGWL